MYDANGKWHKQQVYIGRTKSGIKGLFTQGYLVFRIPPETTSEQAKVIAEENGMEFIIPPIHRSL